MTRTGTIVTLMNMEWMHGTWRAAACKFSIAAPGKSGSPYRQRRLFAGAAAPGTCGKVAIPVIFPAAMSPRLLFTIVFIEGYCSLGAEIIALRRLIPHVGSRFRMMSMHGSSWSRSFSTIRGLALTEHFEPRGHPHRDPWPETRLTLLELLAPGLEPSHRKET